jgi:uncharacterized protein (DUF1919 family)
MRAIIKALRAARIDGVFRGLERRVDSWRFRYRVTKPFTIVSCNCWGAEVYRELKRPYLTPFVGLFLYPTDFVVLCENFDSLIKRPLAFDNLLSGRCGYPVAHLSEDVTIHFMHYSTASEARLKWERRRQRMDSDSANLFFMFCDRDGCSDADIKRFDALPFRHKVCFTTREYQYASALPVLALKGARQVSDGKELYPITRQEFDLPSWLNRHSAVPTRRHLT